MDLIELPRKKKETQRRKYVIENKSEMPKKYKK